MTRVEPSHFDTLSFYVAFDNHRWNDFTPYLYATEDGGKTFHSIANNLPHSSPADYLHVIREDPHNRDLLFVGSSLGVYASIDRGKTWTKFATGLPSVPVFDLKIHPRDHEVMIATHGRGIWFVDVAPLEQITPKTIADAATLYAPRTAYQWGEGPTLGLPGNGWGQAPLVIPAPPYGATISYRLKDSVTGPVKVTVSDAGGTQLYTTNGSAARGLHNVTWAFQSAPTRAALTPSARRDSILLKVRAPVVLDSLAKANYDSAALLTVRRIVNIANNPPAAGAFGGRGGGGGGRGGAQLGCEHPMTQWDNFCARPAEPPPAPAGRGRGGAGAAAGGAAGAAAVAADTSAEGIAAAFAGGGRGAPEPAQQKIWDLIGMKPPAGGRGGGGGFGGGGGNLVEPGTYVATLTAGGQTYKQTFRVERVGTGDDVTITQDEEGEPENLNGGIFPKVSPWKKE